MSVVPDGRDELGARRSWVLGALDALDEPVFALVMTRLLPNLRSGVIHGAYVMELADEIEAYLDLYRQREVGARSRTT